MATESCYVDIWNNHFGKVLKFTVILIELHEIMDFIGAAIDCVRTLLNCLYILGEYNCA